MEKRIYKGYSVVYLHIGITLINVYVLIYLLDPQIEIRIGLNFLNSQIVKTRIKEAKIKNFYYILKWQQVNLIFGFFPILYDFCKC